LKGIENEEKLVDCPPCHKITAPDSMIRILTLKAAENDKKENRVITIRRDFHL
jgi:hypothetical protein